MVPGHMYTRLHWLYSRNEQRCKDTFQCGRDTGIFGNHYKNRTADDKIMIFQRKPSKHTGVLHGRMEAGKHHFDA